jgi:hypothetical protein
VAVGLIVVALVMLRDRPAAAEAPADDELAPTDDGVKVAQLEAADACAAC